MQMKIALSVGKPNDFYLTIRIHFNYVLAGSIISFSQYTKSQIDANLTIWTFKVNSVFD